MARDKFHEEVKAALQADGWNITDDPLTFKIGKVQIQIDLGAEQLIAAERGLDKIKQYEAAILGILVEYAKIKYANVTGGNKLIADRENLRYQVVTVGWEGDRYVHDCPLHFGIIGGKIWVQQNMTEWEVGQMLEQYGIPKSDIVAGFLPPELREYSGYATA